MNVFEPGCKVSCGPFEAEVLTVSISLKGIQYEVGYWFKDEWKQLWVPESQVRSKACKPTRMGFYAKD